MRAGEQLRGRLSELQDLGQHGDPLVRVLDAAQRNHRPVTQCILHMPRRFVIAMLPIVVRVAFIRQRVKDCEENRFFYSYIIL